MQAQGVWPGPESTQGLQTPSNLLMTPAHHTRYKCDLLASYIPHDEWLMKLARRLHLYRVGCARVISC